MFTGRRKFSTLRQLTLSAGALLSLALSACSALPDVRSTEYVWQGLHAVDALQTYRGPASDPCFHEADPVTSRLIGKRPSGAQVLGWYAATSVSHFAISTALEKIAPRLADWWHALTIAGVSITVADNHELGIRIGSSNRGCGR
jgi:hypothetical protein